MASDIGYADEDWGAEGCGDEGWGGADAETDPGFAVSMPPGPDPDSGTVTTWPNEPWRAGRDGPAADTTDAYPGPDIGPAVAPFLHHAIGDALAAPPGALSRDDLIGRTADVLHQALGRPGVAPGHFSDLVGRLVDLLSGLPDDEVGIRQALGRLAGSGALQRRSRPGARSLETF